MVVGWSSSILVPIFAGQYRHTPTNIKDRMNHKMEATCHILYTNVDLGPTVMATVFQCRLVPSSWKLMGEEQLQKSQDPPTNPKAP